MEIKEGQIWVSKDNPHRSIEIYGVVEMFDTTDEGMCCMWKIHDAEAWDKYVSSKLGVNNTQELFDKGKNTFPYPFAGESSFKSMKNRIRKDKLELKGE